MITSIPLLTLLFLLMSAPALVRATCNNFTLEGEPYTLPGPTLYIISSGVVCKGKQNCTILAGGFITANRLLNNSSPDDSVNNDLFALIASASNISFEKSVSDNISTVTQTFEHGTAGYVLFRPDFLCVNGVSAVALLAMLTCLLVKLLFKLARLTTETTTIISGE